MKKTIKCSLIFLLVIISTSFTNNEYKSQSNNFPQIQDYLKKLNGKNVTNGSGTSICISQIVTENSFTKTNKVGKTLWKFESMGINWKSYEKVSFKLLKNKKYCEISIHFEDKFQHTWYEGEETYMESEQKHFTCYILYKDMEAFCEILEDWNKANN